MDTGGERPNSPAPLLLLLAGPIVCCAAAATFCAVPLQLAECIHKAFIGSLQRPGPAGRR